MTQKLAETLGVTPVNVEDFEETIVVSVPNDGLANNVQLDYEFARENLYKSITIGMRALESLYQHIQTDTVLEKIGKAGKYESLATMMKTCAELNKDLLHLSDKRASMNFDTPQEPKDVSGYVGSTTDALRLIREKKKAG